MSQSYRSFPVSMEYDLGAVCSCLIAGLFTPSAEPSDPIGRSPGSQIVFDPFD